MTAAYYGSSSRAEVFPLLEAGSTIAVRGPSGSWD